jgi:hypothetical protein
MKPVIREKKFYSIDGITLWPFILIRKGISGRYREVVVNHETIHFRQQQELLVIFFYVIYGLNWLLNFLRYWNSDKAYRNIIFEKEAYSHEADLSYLQNRKPFAFLKSI